MTFNIDKIYDVNVEIEDEKVISMVKDYFEPDEVFDSSTLEEWALNNGFVLESEIDD